MEMWGFLAPGQYLIHDRDGQYGAAFHQIIDTAGVKRVPLPARSPHLNAYAERWVRSVKDEALSRMILFGEGSLRHMLSEYMEHDHMEDPEFTEVDLRAMLARAAGHHLDVVEGRWVIETRHRRHRWDVIVEPDPVERLLVVVTAYPVED